MRTSFFWGLLLLLVTASGSAMAQTQSSHYKAAETLLLTMDTPKTIDTNLQQMLTMQMEQMPAMKEAEIEVRSFFAKYMSWDAIKEDMVKLYMEEFTEKELKDMTAFFKTPTGKKLAAKQSTLTMRSAQLGQSKIQPHLMELEQILRSKLKDN
ncbi:DUF2059 domain-containing protein [Nibribacter ruber]|uniref:DUF2059 domain-containing protein n=1 Tax=Nibribacter ruber TaxID=2698458 RepID=A0A6P1P3V5_9BACT|nr:DUF2059 domain-containing protein [Nibribacter ruber]QHL89090.1 DUF2059 domain-containing protein [Nibribacter ruber]